MSINIADIDFSNLMDLRVDYAFKLFFASGETHRLVSLLNAIFENKQIPRVLTGLTVINPALEKTAIEDKLSVIDVRATLSDGSTVLIEMHLYDLHDLKYKTVRSLARAYGEELESGEKYTSQRTSISIAFINGPVTNAAGDAIEKVHSLFHLSERDSHELLMTEMELHYVDMAAFMKAYEETGKADGVCESLAKWLLLINAKDVKDKSIFKEISEEKEMSDAIETLNRLSADKVKRQAYQRRLDELHSYNHLVKENEEYRVQLEENAAVLAENAAVLAENAAVLAENAAVLAEKDAALVELEALVEKLKSQLGRED